MRRDAGQVYARTRLACLYALDDPRTEEAVRAVDVVEGCRAVGVGLGVPPVSALGLVEDVLCDRAFVERRHDAAAEVATLTDVEACLQGLLSPEVVRVALTAAGLVRAAGVPAAAVREALRAAPALGGMPELLPGTPRVVLDGDAVSVSTALAALTAARADVVWIAHPDAGAGEEVQRLLRLVAPLLRAVVLTSWPAAPAPQGAAAGSVLAGHLARHAPEVPVHVVAVADTDGRDGVGAALSAAARLAGGDDVVVWAPGVAAGGDLDAVRGAVLALQAGDRPDRRGDGEEE
ncbi:MAG: hypothetical protein U0Q15_13090 [Kineosporiaceae bacterium]